MHHSRLAAIAIDCPSETALGTARFWAGALQAEPRPIEGFDPADPYVKVGSVAGREVFVQQVGEPQARLHLDIETDDVEAEVRRLEALGAKRVRAVRTFWVMEAPTGQRFCVVRAQRANFERDANVWDDPA